MMTDDDHSPPPQATAQGSRPPPSPSPSVQEVSPPPPPPPRRRTTSHENAVASSSSQQNVWPQDRQGHVNTGLLTPPPSQTSSSSSSTSFVGPHHEESKYPQIAATRRVQGHSNIPARKFKPKRRHIFDRQVWTFFSMATYAPSLIAVCTCSTSIKYRRTASSREKRWRMSSTSLDDRKVTVRSLVMRSKIHRFQCPGYKSDKSAFLSTSRSLLLIVTRLISYYYRLATLQRVAGAYAEIRGATTCVYRSLS